MTSELDGISPLHLGWIPYWNLLPLKKELVSLYKNSLHLHEGHPSVVNKMLTAGDVNLAPCSSVCLVKNIRHELALPAGVAAKGPVQSVYLGLTADLYDTIDPFKKRIAQIHDLVRVGLDRYGERKRMAAQYVWKHIDGLPPLKCERTPHLRLTPNSASSAALARIFYRFIFGKAAYEALANPKPEGDDRSSIELLIGDEALIRRDEFAKVIDLSQFWYQMTGLPFVFAVWQRAGLPVSDAWQRRIVEACEIAQAKMRVEPTAYWDQALPLKHDGTSIDLPQYWKHIHYRLSAEDISGLLFFLCLARPLVRAEIDDAMVVKMLRWQQLGDHRSMTV